MKNPSIRQLTKMRACTRGIEWFKDNKKSTLEKTIACADIEGLVYASWFLFNSFNEMEKLRYVTLAVREILYLYRQQFPNDDTAEKAFNAAINSNIMTIEDINLVIETTRGIIRERALYFSDVVAVLKKNDFIKYFAAYNVIQAALLLIYVVSKIKIRDSNDEYLIQVVIDKVFEVCNEIGNKSEEEEKRLLRNIVEYGLELYKDKKNRE